MKKMQLTPNLWEVPTEQAFLPRIKGWKNELSFWQQESESLRRLLIFGALRCSVVEKEYLQMIEKELSIFIQQQIPVAEGEIDSLIRILNDKMNGGKFRKVEGKIEQLRITYQALKMKLLPFFPKFVSAQIW